MNISHFLLKLFIFALGALTLNVNAATCIPTNALYIQDGIINIPCIKVNGERINATFKLTSTKPEHIWALQKFSKVLSHLHDTSLQQSILDKCNQALLGGNIKNTLTYLACCISRTS